MRALSIDVDHSVELVGKAGSCHSLLYSIDAKDEGAIGEPLYAYSITNLSNRSRIKDNYSKQYPLKLNLEPISMYI